MKAKDRVQTPEGQGIIHQEANDWAMVKLDSNKHKVFAKKNLKLVNGGK